jgi:hypothetical protein
MLITHGIAGIDNTLKYDTVVQVEVTARLNYQDTVTNVTIVTCAIKGSPYGFLVDPVGILTSDSIATGQDETVIHDSNEPAIILDLSDRVL